MLIDFTVKNFRSIKDPITLSMVAAPAKKTAAKSSTRRNVKSDYEIAPPFRFESRNLELLPTLGIFGANASGKSNIIRALDYLLSLIGATSISRKTFADLSTPFGLSEATKNAPTCFRLRLTHADTIFTYTLVLDRTRILQERLEYIPPSQRSLRNRLLFERAWREQEKSYVITNGKDFGNAYKELQASVHEQEAFMHLLTKSLTIKIVEPFTFSLERVWPGTALGQESVDYLLAAITLKMLSSTALQSVTKLVQHFDTGIAGIEIEGPDFVNLAELEKIKLNPRDAEKIKLTPEALEKIKVWVVHETDGKQTRWLMEEESTGTQRLFALTFKMLTAFRGGGLVVIDELGSNVHPTITRTIVRMFQSEKTNPKRAQLIFTSHDNTLQRGNLLRRDQIWFTQKRDDGSTELYPLSDFKPRNDLAIDKAYLEGRFGAVPILPSEEELLEPAEAK